MFSTTVVIFVETAVFCENLNQPLNGRLSTFDVLWGTVVSVMCEPGFTFANGQITENLECLETRQWNDTVEDCQRMLYISLQLRLIHFLRLILVLINQIST